MTLQSLFSRNSTADNPATRYFLQNPWGFSYSPVNMVNIIGKLDQLQEDNIANKYRARVGNIVTIYDADIRSEYCMELVNPEDSNPEQGCISIMSPLGSAILGLSKGEWAEVFLVGKTFHFEVRKIA